MAGSFTYRLNVEFVMITEQVDANVLTKSMGIKPTRFLNKGDLRKSEHSSQHPKNPHTLWAIGFTIKHDELTSPLNDCICELQSILIDKSKTIFRLKKKFNLEVAIVITVETDDSGYGFDIDNSELGFLANLVDRFSFFIAGSLES